MSGHFLDVRTMSNRCPTDPRPPDRGGQPPLVRSNTVSGRRKTSPPSLPPPSLPRARGVGGGGGVGTAVRARCSPHSFIYGQSSARHYMPQLRCGRSTRRSTLILAPASPVATPLTPLCPATGASRRGSRRGVEACRSARPDPSKRPGFHELWRAHFRLGGERTVSPGGGVCRGHP
jgi:hypothetical protein